MTPEELQLAKDLLGRAIAREFETPPEVAAALVAQVVEGLPDDYLQDLRRAASRQ